MKALVLLALGLLPVATTTTARAARPAPWSEITTNRAVASKPGEVDEVGVRLVAIDGDLKFQQRVSYKLTPGWHLLHVATTRPDHRGDAPEQPLMLLTEPCVQYDLVAHHENAPGNARWQVKVKAESPIGTCNAKAITP